MRIVSLVPSLTEFLYDLGLDEQIVGRTRFCIHPKGRVDRSAIVGGTKNPNHARIVALKPDLIIANREENRKEDIDALARLLPNAGIKPAMGAEILVTDIQTIDQALQEMIRIGIRCGKEAEARRWVSDIEECRPGRGGIPKSAGTSHQPDNTFQHGAARPSSISTVYLIWKDPWMTIGHDTYIHSVLEEWGFRNLFGGRTRYPAVTLEEIQRLRPECLLLSSEPYPFKESHRTMLAEQLTEQLPDTMVRLIDGEWTSWYGSRMKLGFESMAGFRREVEERRGNGGKPS
jgi:ABC-type Fe3+-hydroxamate transport system substrate-binding protein